MRNATIDATEIRFVPLPRSRARSGLLGFVSFTLNDTLRIDGVAVRKTAGGRLTLSYPARKDSRGVIHHHLRPLNDAIRREIEFQVIQAIGLEGYV